MICTSCDQSRLLAPLFVSGPASTRLPFIPFHFSLSPRLHSFPWRPRPLSPSQLRRNYIPHFVCLWNLHVCMGPPPPPTYAIKFYFLRGAWVAQPVQRPTLGFGSGSWVRAPQGALCCRREACFVFRPPLSLPLPCSLSTSLSLKKISK